MFFVSHDSDRLSQSLKESSRNLHLLMQLQWSKPLLWLQVVDGVQWQKSKHALPSRSKDSYNSRAQLWKG